MAKKSPPQREKLGSNTEVSQDDILEGTSARTRPFSFDDIMLKRQNRGDTIKHVGSEITTARDETEKAFPSSERHRQVDKDSGSMDRQPVNDHRNVSSRRKEDTRKNEKLVQDKDKGSRGSDLKLKSVVTKNVNSNRVTEEENERRHDRHQSTSKKDGLSSAHSDNRSGKRETRDSVRNDRVSERSSKIDREQIYDEDRQVSRKRKTEGRMRSNLENEHEKKIAEDVVQTDKSAVRSRDKSEKENRHKPHSNEGKSRGRSTVKEHDSEEKKTEPRRGYLEESRPKRRRSPGRDNDKERDRRSRSRSPKAHKHTSHDKRDHREPSSPSRKERSGREHIEVDKQRISSNGSSSHYRQNAGSSSGLGGYSPRKRKTEAAAKTPSPTRRSPDGRIAGLDSKLFEKAVIAGSTRTNSRTTSQNMSSNIKETPSGIPLAPSTVKPIENSHNTLSSQTHDIESVQLTQATRPMRRLYAENLPASASDKDLIECINKYLMSSGVSNIQGTHPCISCIIHKEKGQALLEFLTPEYATAALSFNGISFSGSILKLRRPKDYANITTGIPDKSMVVVDSISPVVEDSPHKIFVGGISKRVSSEMLLEIAKVFGPVKAYHYEFNDEPCAFLEYVDHSVTLKACAGLNGMKLAGQVVTAVFATPNVVLENVGGHPFYGIPEHAKPLLVKPKSVLKLKNVLDSEGLLTLSESEIEEVLEDIRLECSRFGTVKSVNVVKPKNSASTTEADEVENTNATTNVRDLEIENSSVTGQLSQSLNEFGEADRSEPPAAFDDMKNSGQTVENNDCDNSADLSNTLLSRSLESDNLTNDEICKPPSGDENITAREPSCHDESGYELERDDNGVGSISERNNVDGNKSLKGEELKSDENSVKVASLELERKESDASEGDKNDVMLCSVEDAFEPGSVFVEYKRAEAACMAAHCLHGRLFDGRVVAAGYVSLDLYCTRFN